MHVISLKLTFCKTHMPKEVGCVGLKGEANMERLGESVSQFIKLLI